MSKSVCAFDARINGLHQRRLPVLNGKFLEPSQALRSVVADKNHASKVLRWPFLRVSSPVPSLSSCAFKCQAFWKLDTLGLKWCNTQLYCWWFLPLDSQLYQEKFNIWGIIVSNIFFDGLTEHLPTTNSLWGAYMELYMGCNMLYPVRNKIIWSSFFFKFLFIYF